MKKILLIGAVVSASLYGGVNNMPVHIALKKYTWQIRELADPMASLAKTDPSAKAHYTAYTGLSKNLEWLQTSPASSVESTWSSGLRKDALKGANSLRSKGLSLMDAIVRSQKTTPAESSETAKILEQLRQLKEEIESHLEKLKAVVSEPKINADKAQKSHISTLKKVDQELINIEAKVRSHVKSLIPAQIEVFRSFLSAHHKLPKSNFAKRPSTMSKLTSKMSESGARQKRVK